MLRMFCAVYDALGSLPTLAQIIVNKYAPPETPDKAQARTEQNLVIAHYRYTLYLDLLVNERNSPKDQWPLPPWHAIIP